MTSRRRNRGTGSSSIDRSLREHLFEDEQVVMVARPGRLATLPKYVATLGLYALWRKRNNAVVTDQRILLGRGILRRDERSIPLDCVEDVTFARRGIYSYADLVVQGLGSDTVRRIGPMTPRAAHRFAKEILRRL